MLSKFTRPSFLYWDFSVVGTLFGSALRGKIECEVDRAALRLAGVIARPLYKCTEVVDPSSEEVCMNVASMSRFLQNTAARGHYRCKECAERAQGAGGAPGLASAARRALYLYPMVEAPDGEPTPLRAVAPHRVLVHAPPDSWGWGAEPVEPPVANVYAQANPLLSSTWYAYNAEESKAMWVASKAYKATPPHKK